MQELQWELERSWIVSCIWEIDVVPRTLPLVTHLRHREISVPTVASVAPVAPVVPARERRWAAKPIEKDEKWKAYHCSLSFKVGSTTFSTNPVAMVKVQILLAIVKYRTVLKKISQGGKAGAKARKLVAKEGHC